MKMKKTRNLENVRAQPFYSDFGKYIPSVSNCDSLHFLIQLLKYDVMCHVVDLTIGKRILVPKEYVST